MAGRDEKEQSREEGHNLIYKAPRASLQLSDFEIVRRLGEGSFSHVFQVVLKATGVQYALKVVDKHLILRHKQVDIIKRERHLLDRLDDSGIVKLYFTFQDNSSLYFGLELCPHGELFDQIQLRKPFPVSDARFYAAELVLILAYLRTEKIVHRDVKPENLLLDAEGHLKLIDFGCTKDLKPPDTLTDCNKRSTSLVGTADYVPPEVLDNEPVSFEADLWALGCIIFQMLTGKPPFKAASEYLTFQKVLACEYSVPDGFPEDAHDLVKHLLVKDPTQRIGSGSEGIQALKQHRFFKGIDWDRLRSLKAPEVLQRQCSGGSADDFDWELSSLAASLPLKCEYDSSARAPAEGGAGPDTAEAGQ